MKYFTVTCVIVFLTACNSAFPTQKREISAFIPREKVLVESDFTNFAATMFPEKCKWFPFTRTIDGDTIVLGDKTKVRFVGIDTPETVHPTKPIQFCGPEASSWIKNVFDGDRKVCLIFDSLSDKKDKYGRRLAYPFTEEGVDTTAELLKLGFARGYFYFPFSRKEEFQFYHDMAKNLEKGVWSKRSEHPECESITVSK